MFAIAAASAVTLVRVELRRTQPLLEVRFFRSLPFSGASLIAVLAFGVLGGFLFLNTLYLQDARGYSALHAGLLTLPMAVLIFVFAPISGRLVGSRGPRLPLVLAGVAIMAAALLLIRLSDGTPVPWLLASYVVFGLGFGLVNAPISNTAVSGMPDSQAGVAASVASASRQAGSALGVAITGSLIAGASNADLAAASHAAWAVLAACGLGIVVLGWASTGPRALATAQRVRETLGGEAVGPAGPAQGSAAGAAGPGRVRTGRRSLMARPSKARDDQAVGDRVMGEQLWVSGASASRASRRLARRLVTIRPPGSGRSCVTWPPTIRRRTCCAAR